MVKTYTEYKLTDSQLRRLSALYHNRKPKTGVAMLALIRKNLAYVNAHNEYQINGNGCMAFKKARAEGW